MSAFEEGFIVEEDFEPEELETPERSEEEVGEEELAELWSPVLRPVTRRKMGTIKLGGPKFEVTKYDGRTDYLLWERQVKGVLRATGLGKLLKDQPSDVDIDDWQDMQEQAVSTVMLYLQPNVIKQLADYVDCASLFAALQQKYHQKELSNRLYTSLKLMSFKMKEGTAKIQDHIDGFNDLVVDLQNLGEDLSDERQALHLLSSLPSSYQSLSRVLLHRDRKTITYNEVVSALLTDDLQQKLTMTSQPSSSSGAALNVNRGRSQQRTNGRGRSKSRTRFASRGKSQERKPVVCWKCGKAGHVKRDCKGKAAESSSANVARADGEADLLNDEYVL